MSLFAVAAYVYDCAGGATPSGANENGETTCQCPAGMVYVDGDCVAGTLANKCKAKGWRVTVQFGSLEYCAVGNVNGLVANLTGDRFANDCLFVENPAPGDEGCHLQFGPNVDFPQRPADGSFPHYAFNCGWTSGNVPTNTGLLPENAANGATNCYCEDSTATHFGATVTDNGAGVTLRYDGVLPVRRIRACGGGVRGSRVVVDFGLQGLAMRDSGDARNFVGGRIGGVLSFRSCHCGLAPMFGGFWRELRLSGEADGNGPALCF